MIFKENQVPSKTVNRSIFDGECIDLFRAAIKYAEEHNSRTFDFSAGDVGAVPFAYGHYTENTS